MFHDLGNGGLGGKKRKKEREKRGSKYTIVRFLSIARAVERWRLVFPVNPAVVQSKEGETFTEHNAKPSRCYRNRVQSLKEEGGEGGGILTRVGAKNLDDGSFYFAKREGES